ncbi:hypothetical protein ASPZODRAFT_103682 [Penicilliopsis zonata CBS 506.65]|uniref:Cytochrome P450 n=1 Tax=Penicilliopsis zonata CBS 506.65 TaxID=1073090 RepID=A0A1L9S7V7_9EURO|nr:hypothetical protein ASPZODRAFT_103682 [Penicilliopsis zonata CBS 506.65]OJJ43242.1 hypothetical protein ASPZODRAFT_103682 [Penicilliopsis zonata CBS 506.65]
MLTAEACWLFAWTSALAATVWFVIIVVHRIFFHPLAAIPGPLLGRATYLYSFWFNVWGARFYLQVEKLHQQYGPVVRITPSEIHLSNPSNIEKIYYIGSRYGKCSRFYSAFGSGQATFTIASPDLHRVKRAALNPFFSRKRVLELEEIVQEKVYKLESRMREALAATGRIDLHYGFRAISIDVITDYAFNSCYDFLDRKDFGVEFFSMLRDLSPWYWYFQQFPSLQPLAMATPLWLAKWTSKTLTLMLTYEGACRRQILKVKADIDAGVSKQIARPSIFYQLLQPDASEGYVVPTVEELKCEAYTIIAAAADTTGNALTIAAYNVVTNAEIYRKLTQELRDAFPDIDAEMEFLALEKLPYLTAVIKEALRLSFGVAGRLPRTVPEGGAEFNGHFVPEGTVVSMSSWMIHHNEDIFPNAEVFDPTRWTDKDKSKALEKYLFSFGKGSRQCVGMSLAYCELYVTLGRVFRQFDNLKTRIKTRQELLYDDYFSMFHPEEYNKFYFERSAGSASTLP